MRINAIGAFAIATDPTASAAWLARHFGFQVTIDIGWYVNMQHPDHPNLHFDFCLQGHDSIPATERDHLGGGLGFLVDDVDAEAKRLEEAGVEFLLAPVTELWGQRRFQVLGPDNLCIEVIQMVEPDPAWLAEHGIAQE